MARIHTRRCFSGGQKTGSLAQKKSTIVAIQFAVRFFANGVGITKKNTTKWPRWEKKGRRFKAAEQWEDFKDNHQVRIPVNRKVNGF